ncbi:unnamed protein product, partial [Mesorhabditis belari]|uniref:Uncharacterized protein n=1 Tax=Mesorhabditis belari TaxID=2138241 RepID=A0AAF3EJN5_9BILA
MRTLFVLAICLAVVLAKKADKHSHGKSSESKSKESHSHSSESHEKTKKPMRTTRLMGSTGTEERGLHETEQIWIIGEKLS